MMASHPASESPLRLTVGALVAYECLLDEAAGTTSWRVGAVRELPQHHSSERMTYADVVKGVAGAVTEHPSTEQPSSVVHDDTDSPPLHVSGTAGQTVLIQPWISLAAATATPEASAAAQPVGRQASPSPQPQHQPQQQQQAVTPAVRFAEIEAMQRELEEIERFARGDSRTHADGDEQDKEEEALAKTLSLAYGRLLASASQPQWGGMADSGRHSTDGCLAASQSANEEGGGVDANPELTRQIEEKRAEFRQRIEHVMAEMKETRQKQRELQQEEAAAQKSLDDARLQLRETQEKVQKIDMRALREIQSYRLPPAVVKLVMSAVLCVLGERAGTWQDVVNAMRGSTFIANVAAFDSSQLTAGRLNELKRTYISDPHFSHEDAVKGSQALGQFHEWVMRQVQLVDADGYLEKFRKRKEASTAALAETRKQLESDAAELTHLEKELDALLHERVRQQEQLMLSRSGATASPRSAAAGDAVEHSAEGTAADLQGDSHSGVTEAQTRPRQLSVFSAPGGGDGATMVVACDGDSSDERGAAGRRGSTTMAQQQQLLALLPPGSQWACPPAGAVLSTHILRSSILCVLGHTGADEANNASSLPGLSTTAPDAADSEAGAAESAVLELSDAQQRSIEDALRQPWPERPPMPLTVEEAAAEAARQRREEAQRRAAEAARRATTTSHHVRVFEGDEWDMVVEDSPEELRRALVADVAAISDLPASAVHDVHWTVGSLHVQCNISHPAEVSDKELQQRLEDGTYPTVMKVYDDARQRCARQETDAAAEAEAARRTAALEQQLHDSLAAQERLARELQASEVAHAAALKSTEQEKETTLRNAKEAAEQRVDELTKQLEEAEAARKEQEARREEEAAEAEKAHRATQQELEDTKQKLRAADDAVKQRDSDLAKQQEVRQEETAEADAKAAEAEAKAAEAEAKAAEAEKAQRATQQELEEVQERLQVASYALKELQNEIHRETKQSQAAQEDREAAQQRVDELTQQLEEAEAARKEQEARWGQEVSEAQVTAGAAAAAEEKHRATQQELEDTKQKLRVASDVLKKLEIQSRKDAKEAERRLLAAEKAQQQLAAESKKTEKESAELERKLRAAQAALQEQGKIHHAEVVKLLAKIADSEAARRQLQEAHTAARGAAQQAEERKAAQAAAEQRWADAQAALAVAVVARRDVAVAAQQHCEAETRRHADAAAEAAKRREERRAALERIRAKAAALAETTVDGGAAPDAEAARQSKDAMAQEVAQELRAMRRERASVDADVAHSRRSVVARQQEVSRASLNVERQQRRVEEETEHRRALAPDGDAAAVTDSAATREAELEALRAEVAAADAGFAAACAELAAREEQRLRDCAEDEAELAALLCVEGGLDRTSGGADGGAVAQVMREVHERATSSFLQRHPVAVMNSCLGGLLITALATLQYKKYAV